MRRYKFIIVSSVPQTAASEGANAYDASCNMLYGGSHSCTQRNVERSLSIDAEYEA